MEIVQRRMEIMSSELEQMRRTKLLNQDNCKYVQRWFSTYGVCTPSRSPKYPKWGAPLRWESLSSFIFILISISYDSNSTSYYSDRQILKMRKHFEYKINGIAKNRQDFMDYIEHEKTLLQTIKHRRNTMKIGEKMGDIEHKIMNRVKELYETTIHRFPDDTTLCLAYFKFCKQANYMNAASVAISNMLKVSLIFFSSVMVCVTFFCCRITLTT